MKAQTYQLEMQTISTRTRQFVGGSVAVHLLLISLLFIQQKLAPEKMGITEITWIDPVEFAAVAPDPPSREAAQRDETTPIKEEPVEKFRRELQRAEVAPDPQRDAAVEDRLSDKLSSLRRTSSKKPPGLKPLASPTKVRRPVRAGTPSPTTQRTSSLSREDTPKNAPLQLKRVESSKARPAVAVPAKPESRPSSSVPARIDEATARRDFGDAQIAGPVADRPILSYEAPSYPDWAKRDGLEGSVTLYFIVLPDGHLKENIQIQKTAGFQDFDNNAVAALRKWRFKPLPAGQTSEQWGAITFHYRLGGN